MTSFICNLLTLTRSANLECSYEYYTWSPVGQTYHCNIRNDPYINSTKSAVIEFTKGAHEVGKTNKEVTGFYAYNKTIQFFPRELQKAFKNLKLIEISYSRLKEIHQSDLRSLPRLNELYLAGNDIEFLEEGLFDLNPDLERISFRANKIAQIHPEVFDGLSKVTYLDLDSNRCIQMYAYDNITELRQVIKAVKLKCLIVHPTTTSKPFTSTATIFVTAAKFIPDSIEEIEDVCRVSFLELNKKISIIAKDLKNSYMDVLKVVEDRVKSENNILRSSLTEANKKIDNLEKALKISQEKFESFRSQVEFGFEKILKKIDSSSDKFEKVIVEQVEKIEEEIKSAQNESILAMNEKIESLEKNLHTFNRSEEEITLFEN